MCVCVGGGYTYLCAYISVCAHTSLCVCVYVVTEACLRFGFPQAFLQLLSDGAETPSGDAAVLMPCTPLWINTPRMRGNWSSKVEISRPFNCLAASLAPSHYLFLSPRLSLPLSSQVSWKHHLGVSFSHSISHFFNECVSVSVGECV